MKDQYLEIYLVGIFLIFCQSSCMNGVEIGGYDVYVVYQEELSVGFCV